MNPQIPRPMKKILITKSDLDKDNRYTGKEILSDWGNPFDGSIEIEENLGYVSFEKSIVVKGSITAKAGSGIKAGEGIKAGWGIEAGSGIEAGWGIKAGEGIKAGWGIVSLYSWIKAKLSISINVKCTIAAGIFSLSGAQDVEAQEIVGAICYGNIKILPKEEAARKSESLSGKSVKVVVDGKEYEAVIK